MAREKMVTRTVDITTAEVMTLDVTTAEVEIKAYEVAGLYKDSDLLDALKKAYETDTLKLVHINSTSTKEILYGMTESDFIKNATILPPRTKSEELA